MAPLAYPAVSCLLHEHHQTLASSSKGETALLSLEYQSKRHCCTCERSTSSCASASDVVRKKPIFDKSILP